MAEKQLILASFPAILARNTTNSSRERASFAQNSSKRVLTFLEILPETPQILAGIGTILFKTAGLKSKKRLFLPLRSTVLTQPLQGKMGQN